MNIGLKRMARGAVLGCMLTAGCVVASAQDAADMPLIMTLNTNIYGYQGPSNSFTIYLGSTEEDVEVYVVSPTAEEYVTLNPWSIGTDSDGSSAAIATAVGLSVTEKDNEIKIYGDPAKIDFIDVHGCYMNSVVLPEVLPNLTVIDLSHNELTAIDLSSQTSLQSIDLEDNSFTDASKMVIGTNHPMLTILMVGVNDVCDPQLDLTNFPALQYFSARNNYGVYNVDVSQCPQLISLVLEVTNVASIDVSQNQYLNILNLSQTRVNSIDVSKNANLGELYLSHEGSFNNEDQYRLTSIDLSKNTRLERLDLSGNALTSIDLSNNPYIKMLYLQRNLLTSIDVSNLKGLGIFNISNNLMTFATLPIPQEGWDYYYYRSALPCDLKYKVNEPIDFSASVIRAPYVDAAGNTITPATYANVFAIPAGKDQYEVPADSYTFDKGILTFNQALPDSVYVQFYCNAFPDWPMNSANFMVKTAEDFDAPSAAFSFKPANSMAGKEISFSLGAGILTSAVSYPADVTLIVNGESTVIKGAVTGNSLPASANVTFTLPSESNNITVALPDGFAISALSMENISLSSIDLSPAEALSQLALRSCGLASVNLAYNRALTNLDLSGNVLRTLDLSGIRGDYQKYSLSTINLANNKLTSLQTVSAATIYNLDLSGNSFSQFDLKYYTGLKNINLSNNRLTGTIDFSTVQKLQSADISGNSINAIVLNTEEEALDDLKSFNVSGNNLTLASLPIFNKASLEYTYAPQNKLEILSSAAAINLSAQNIVINGKGTVFTWLYADNNQPVANTLYSNDGGATIFSEELVGKQVYCQMTNPAFPAFDAMPFTTTNITVASKPNILIATLQTAESGTAQIGFRFNKSGDNAVYIDWRGDGSEYEPYIYEANASYPSIYREGKAYAGATAKVYSYDPATSISVFALNGIKLKKADLSPMTEITAINLHNAGLTDGNLILPESKELFELILDGNAFVNQNFPGYPNISNLNLANNKYTSIDLSVYPRLGFAQLADNAITSLIVGENQPIYKLDLTNNKLTSIDLSAFPQMQELLLSNNSLTEIDLSPVKESLNALSISGNKFTFATLPDVSEMGSQFTYFDYFSQQPMQVACYEYKIDLSSQAEVRGEPTQYYWFLGNYQNDVYFDYYYEEFVGERLQGPDDSDDPEYTIENGVTTFLYPQSQNVICAMTNAEYPSLILYTAPTRLSEAGIEQLFGTDTGLVDVVTVNGVKLKSKVTVSEALQGLAPGLYIIGGQKILVK